MRWHLSARSADYEITLDAGGPPGAVELPGGEAEAVLHRAGHDAMQLETLRRVYAELVDRSSAATTSDLVLVAELCEAIQRRRVRVWTTPRLHARTDAAPTSTAEVDLGELTDLRSAPAPAEPPPPSAAVLHQVEILKRAAEHGTPLCEECECE